MILISRGVKSSILTDHQGFLRAFLGCIEKENYILQKESVQWTSWVSWTTGDLVPCILVLLVDFKFISTI